MRALCPSALPSSKSLTQELSSIFDTFFDMFCWQYSGNVHDRLGFIVMQELLVYDKYRIFNQFLKTYFHIGVAHWPSTTCYLHYNLTFFANLLSSDTFINCRVWCERERWTFRGEKRCRRQFIYIFKYFMKIWRMKKKSFRTALPGCFWLGWLWLHCEFISYWMNWRNATLLTVCVWDLF